LEARKVTGLQVRNNRFEGYTNRQNSDGNFVPGAVIRIASQVANRGDETCGPPPKPPCPYFIHYPEEITMTGNTIIQHVEYSPGIELTDADPVVIADNNISHTHKVSPVGNYDPNDPILRPIGIDLFFGVQNPNNGFFLCVCLENPRVRADYYLIDHQVTKIDRRNDEKSTKVQLTISDVRTFSIDQPRS
jgi:hypothetical protein